ncbi:hypothetical protein GCM10022284_67360 [Streptomyces hundungensis]
MAKPSPVTWWKKTRLNGTYIPEPVASTAMATSIRRSPAMRAVRLRLLLRPLRRRNMRMGAPGRGGR